MGNVGDELSAQNANWNFKGEVARNFDGHVSRSVPLYNEGHELTCRLSDYFVKNDSVCYELGCSTGQLSLKLAKHNSIKSGARFIGFDVEEDMVRIARENQTSSGLSNLEFHVDDVMQVDLQKSDFIVAYYTVQFIRPSQRQILMDKIYQTLNWGGAFLLFEKVRANDARFQDIMSAIYQDFKLSQGYSPDEIVSKARSLKGILEPFSTQGNIDLLKRAGFVDVISVMKYVCFEGFLAIK